jgi:hypothetical protein
MSVLARVADSSRTSPDVREVPTAVIAAVRRRDVMEYWAPDCQSLRPEACELDHLPHFSISAVTWVPNSAGVKIFGVVATIA